jgi:hypothetical protein
MREVSDDIFSAVMEDMRRAAEAEIVPRFLGVTAEGIRTKSAPDDLVTDADLGAEWRLTEALSARFPEALLIGEEAVSADPAILARLADADLAVIIDPVDGTWNFAHGLPLFGMIVAIVSGGETVAGLIHYPVTGEFLAARPGEGVRILAFPDEFDLTEQTLAFFPELATLFGEAPRAGWRKRQVRAERAYGTPVVWECAPAVLVFPRVTGLPASELTPLSPGEALLELAPNVLLTEARSSQGHLDALAELVERSACYRLATGTDLAAAVELLEELMR